MRELKKDYCMRNKLLWVGLFWFLSSCEQQESCAISMSDKYSGNGLLVVQRVSGEDGWYFLRFFPVCQMDTTNLLASLRQSETGLMFYTNQMYRLIGPTSYGQIKSPFKNKMLQLTSTDPVDRNVHCWNCGLNDLFIIPVHLTFSGATPSHKTYQYLLKAKEATIPLRIRGAGNVQIDELSAL
ncbi:hypothetical protein LGH70_04500 [Hymenobacter sp. BT635]|uniref:Lipoprotein n=1 Tax=Hymenobacter nitidus TaxID=2880929 RepID=A0ABS8AAR8_9BACT|nr:hypothetical protein [Hymenobacter nitidus]MCB2376827.1 hypothetical protein [Hymenobacter nitidus]